MSTIYHHRGRVAALSRSRASDDPEFIAAKTDLVAANIADYLIRTLAAAPPLTDEQRTRLAELLRPVRRSGVPDDRRRRRVAADATMPATEDRAPATVATPSSADPTASRAVSWWSVHEHVAPVLDAAGSWPMAGTPAWRQLDDADPRKWAAICDAARHWALRVETCQEAMAQASRDVSAAADWPGIAREIVRRRGVYIPRAGVA